MEFTKEPTPVLPARCLGGHVDERGRGVHGVARPLPPPVRSHAVSEASRRVPDELDREMAEWVEGLRFGGTEAAD